MRPIASSRNRQAIEDIHYLSSVILRHPADLQRECLPPKIARRRSPPTVRQRLRNRQQEVIVNDQGELLAFHLTQGHVDDCKPGPKLAKDLFDKLFGDRGYISQKLQEVLSQQNLQLITKLRKNMKNRLLLVFDQILLRKRALIETVNDQLKHICQIEHSRPRSRTNFCVNVVAALIAYTFREKLPSLNIRVKELEQLPALV